MLKLAAITSLRGFNRRYFHWLFKLQGDALVDMQHVQMSEVGRGDTCMLEDHEECKGQGCSMCGWIGRIGRRVEDKVAPAYQPYRLS
jgi:hypothetical protein